MKPQFSFLKDSEAVLNVLLKLTGTSSARCKLQALFNNRGELRVGAQPGTTLSCWLATPHLVFPNRALAALHSRQESDSTAVSSHRHPPKPG